ncbi:MAG: NADH-quinone oxidoreductase subunit C [Methanoregula sp.]|jgi:NADH-quinone oxidoreductase subunit C|uniref:NADH-quinone oxidoreductase subunit C n=1 Tax=Methanoregula sp. TaxID=2052170 RepID=UPI003C173FD1
MTGPLTLAMVAGKMKEFGNSELVRKNRIRITTTPDKVHDTIRAVQAMLGCDRLITISAVDNSRTLELIYHLTGPHRMIISIAIELERDQPAIPTSSDILPPAAIYERQIHDLFGIVFTGNPNLNRIMLNEDWPVDEYPLRKDWKPGPDTFYGGIKVERT